MNLPADDPGDITVSFEFFPPKGGEAEAGFWRTIAKLETVAPRFVSVTYGAGGTTRDRTLATVARLASAHDAAPRRPFDLRRRQQGRSQHGDRRLQESRCKTYTCAPR